MAIDKKNVSFHDINWRSLNILSTGLLLETERALISLWTLQALLES
jgi:hypothetical protein